MCKENKEVLYWKMNDGVKSIFVKHDEMIDVIKMNLYYVIND